MRYVATSAHVSSNIIHEQSSRFITWTSQIMQFFSITESQVINQTGNLNPQVMNQLETCVCVFGKSWPPFNSCDKLYCLWNVLVATFYFECHVHIICSYLVHTKKKNMQVYEYANIYLSKKGGIPKCTFFTWDLKLWGTPMLRHHHLYYLCIVYKLILVHYLLNLLSL